MLTYGNIIEIGEKGERLGFWSLAFPAVPDGVMGLSVLRDRWEFRPASELEAMAELAPIIAEIREKTQMSKANFKG